MERYRPAIHACRLGMFVQATAINFTPLLFVPLRDAFGLDWEQLGRLVLVNFAVQIAADLACGGLLRLFCVRALCVAAQVLAAAGLLIFATAPSGGGYAAMLAGTAVFSAGCGLMEVLLSPLINAVPSSRKAGDMALLHAFYPLGKLAVVVGTAVALALAGTAAWPWVAVGWAAIPLAGAWLFAVVELPALPPGSGGQRLRELARGGRLWLVLAAMVLAGASELAIAQWTTAYAERGLGFSAATAQLVGFGCFAAGMAAGRIWYGLRGGEADLPGLLLRGSLASAAVYLVAALAPWPPLALLACALAGAAVSMLWPWTVSIAAAAWPLAGATLFAALAAAGDLGAAVQPWLIGLVADHARWDWLPGSEASSGLRAGLLVGAAAPCLLALVALALRRAQAASR